MLNKLFQFIRQPLNHLPQRRKAQEAAPFQHDLSPEDISPNALYSIERLQQAGYSAYVVGGCVRDLLLGIRPKDYDVVTDATPDQIRSLFHNARIIGRRFQLVHLPFGRELIEVATFRAEHSYEDEDEQLAARNASGRILRDNIFGSLDDDAYRRDFTINALYYDPVSEQIIDHVQGVRDIRERQIRLIGSPKQRYQEDPVRMLRAVRFAAKLDCQIEPHTAAPIRSLAHLLAEIPPARLYEEVLKLFLNGQGVQTFELLQKYQLFAPLFPATALALQSNYQYTNTLIHNALANTDLRIAQGKPITPAFLFAALLWPALPARSLELQAQGLLAIPALQEAAQEILWEQCQRTAIPKRFSIPVREIWDLQERLPRRQGKRADALLENPRFRAGYDFLLLRESAGEQTEGLGQWWTQYQEASDSERRAMISALKTNTPPTHQRKKRRPR
ncbi:poly(A) polymerase [Azomonas agilis]|uniref:Poly(A) polymerase I n=1 Tax=Azomonas agilis TaxID=116849 RepID=A0A562J2N0_9GAMM|nr:polynucleotide adenylyltransferase PcnB [Azomonas agilis]TWH77372.1 poly(A) polymerase [Azomonas agilis]